MPRSSGFAWKRIVRLLQFTSMDTLHLTRMTADDIETAADLVARTMDENEGRWARQTISTHFASRRHGVEDGREYLVWKQQEQLCGLVGLHHYSWGPPRNVWLGWFAISPEYQGRGAGHQLLSAAKEKARSAGYTKLFVETYDTPAFARARRFYETEGLSLAGAVENYLDNGARMLVYMCTL